MTAFLPGFFFVCMLPFISASLIPSNNVTYLSFYNSFSTLSGDQNLQLLDENGTSVRISLTESSGCGFSSRLYYQNAYFSATIKLPSSANSAGVVVAFYTTNADVFKSNHDELDFEFLGKVPGKEWFVQTNLFGNESVNRGREEKFKLWFNPEQDFHTYSLIWNNNWTVFYVDDVPIREVQRIPAMGGDYASKPMSLYATIWDGSDWATGGGKHKVNYRYAPFDADFGNFIIQGQECSKDQVDQCNDSPISSIVSNFNGLNPDARSKMKDYRDKYMIYSYCQDQKRYPIKLPECRN